MVTGPVLPVTLVIEPLWSPVPPLKEPPIKRLVPVRPRFDRRCLGQIGVFPDFLNPASIRQAQPVRFTSSGRISTCMFMLLVVGDQVSRPSRTVAS